MEKFKHLETILTSDRIDVFLRLAPVAYLVGMASFHIQQAHIWDAKHGLLLMGDYICYWLAAVTVLAGAPFDVYDNDAFRLVAENFVAEYGYLPFMYPPTYLLAMVPFGLLPNWLSHILFFSLTLGALALVGRIIWGGWKGALIACAFPGVLGVLIHGQNSFLTAALFGGALAALGGKRYILAGVLIGCMTYKPQIGVLIPFALLAGRFWTTFITAGVTTVVLAALPAVAFGPEIWLAFLEQSKFAATLLDQELVEFWKYLSIYAGLRMLGLPDQAAMVAQLFFAAGCLVWVLRLWRSDAPFELRAAGLVAASLLASPYMLTYEYIILAVPILFLARHAVDGNLLPFDTTLYVLIVLLILSARAIADYTGIPLGSAPVLLTMFLTHRYYKQWEHRRVNVAGSIRPPVSSPAPGA
ncbi:glycosyltransferase family 87 protein [Roseibium sp.]|uniref:glycosyltransferase family 87 protein n=1 Tax=Roseibium sp. TaxID=1936156 RepID=UPI003B500BC8